MQLAGAAGWTSAKPGSAATASQILGLYFMVHEPRGYAPRSTENWRWLRRVKCPTRSRSDTSASATGPSRRCASGTRSSRGTSGTPVVRSCQALRPGSDSSKSVGSLSRPEQRSAGGTAPGGGGRDEVVDHHRTALSKAATKASISARVRRSVTATSSPSSAPGCRSDRGRYRPGTLRRPGAPPPSRTPRGGGRRIRAAPEHSVSGSTPGTFNRASRQ